MLRRFFFAAVITLAFAVPAAQAEKIKYLSDPPYQTMAPEDAHPMDDMKALAKEGDLRAQFILGDLYSKGKGALKKNTKQARYWFENSAYHGYSFSFIRLAALDKRAKKPEEAYKWYTLCMDKMSGDERKWCDKSRDELVKSANMTREQIKSAKKKAGSWFKDKKAELEAAAAPKDAPVKKTDAGDAAKDAEAEKVMTAAEALTLNPPAAQTAPEEMPKTKTAAEAVEETKTQKE